MQAQSEMRIKKRLHCTLRAETGRHSGLVLNLSESGLFVQTSLPAEPGTRLAVAVRDPAEGCDIPLEASVVWRRRVSPRMTGVNQSGMGLRLLNRPDAWQSMMSDILDLEFDAGSTTGVPRFAEVVEAAEDPRPEEVEIGDRYVVRLAEAGSPRSRRIEVVSKSEVAARSDALRQAGSGWTVLEVRRR